MRGSTLCSLTRQALILSGRKAPEFSNGRVDIILYLLDRCMVDMPTSQHYIIHSIDYLCTREHDLHNSILGVHRE